MHDGSDTCLLVSTSAELGKAYTGLKGPVLGILTQFHINDIMLVAMMRVFIPQKSVNVTYWVFFFFPLESQFASIPLVSTQCHVRYYGATISHSSCPAIVSSLENMTYIRNQGESCYSCAV